MLLIASYRGDTIYTPAWETIVIMAMIAVMTIAAVPMVLHLRRRAMRPRTVSDGWQAMAAMGELCPRGWQATITLYGSGAPLPDDAPASRERPIELEWTLFAADPRRAEVERRAWAPSIGEALQMMVERSRSEPRR